MRKLIHFSKGFLPAAIISITLIVFGIAGFIFFTIKDGSGFNLGVDFQAGLQQEVQIAPPAFSVTFNGKGDASISMSQSALSIVVTGADVGAGETYTFPFAKYPTLDALAKAITEQDNGAQAKLVAAGTTASTELLQSAYGNPQLGDKPYTLHYLNPTAKPVTIADVRSAFPARLGEMPIQELGKANENHFMVRLDIKRLKQGEDPAAILTKALNDKFGAENMVIIQSNMVDSRFSQNLTGTAALLFVLTIILILIYVSFRFKPQFAIGAVLAIFHDALIMVCFIVWTRMEFNTTTIAAILTILGYSINDTIVIFDRVREDSKLNPDGKFLYVLDRAITDCLSRTLVTTLTTMVAVLSLLIFTTGSMRDFAAALLVGMTSGCYSTIYIACGFANFWEVHIKGFRQRHPSKPKVKKAPVKKPRPNVEPELLQA
jgi:preprotein translocase subunit SecF